MHGTRFIRGSLLGATAVLLALQTQGAAAKDPKWISGDFHNHTTCTDGSTSVKVLIEHSFKYLDWFTNSGHGGSGVRDCRFNDPEGDAHLSGEGKLWVDTIGVDAIKGDVVTSSGYRAMWRWQMIQEFDYPETVKASLAAGKLAMQGLEQNVPGHEHASTSIIAGQFPKNGKLGNANAMAQFEYLFDAADNDLSGGAENRWRGKIIDDNHNKAVAGVAWMQQNYAVRSYNVPAHAERVSGWDIKSFRDYNNTGPTVAFGFESEPGHQAVGGRGGYGGGAVGGGTYGGVGFFASQVGGVWDALLGEGRNWFYFASSDYHSRGSFSPWDSATTGDFWPGEFQKTYIPFIADLSPRDLVRSLRLGNAYAVQGDLIGNDLTFEICNRSGCEVSAQMGQTLVVPIGSDVKVTLKVSDPNGKNRSPYSFANPVLTQVGITRPLDTPVLDHIDLITGKVTKKVLPSDPNYTNGTNSTTQIVASFNESNWKEKGETRTITYTIKNVQDNMYVRARGTNMPYGVPNATDEDGNPLLDTNADNIVCAEPACPEHLVRASDGVKIVNYDVEAWSHLWFYTNPIFIRLQGTLPLPVEEAAVRGTSEDRIADRLVD
jgi:hypothetical protein